MLDLPQTMKAAVVRQIGGADAVVTETDFPTPKLKPGEVIVKNSVGGLNFIDTYFRSGLYKMETPFVSGQEGGGEIAAASPEAEAAGLAVGQRVVYMAPGSCAHYTAVPAAKCVPLPDGVDMDAAVACMVQGLTAHYLVTSAHADLIKPGDGWMLIYSIGSGTCQWAAQMAKILGYKVIGTTSKSKLDIAKTVGCDELIVFDSAPGATYANYESVDVIGKVMGITGGEGCKCVVDGVGLSTYEISLECLATRGIFISFGNASGAVPAFPLLRLNKKSNFVTRPKLGDYVASPSELASRTADVFNWLKGGKLRISIDKIFTLDEVANAHMHIESGKSKGKILYRID